MTFCRLPGFIHAYWPKELSVVGQERALALYDAMSPAARGLANVFLSSLVRSDYLYNGWKTSPYGSQLYIMRHHAHDILRCVCAGIALFPCIKA